MTLCQTDSAYCQSLATFDKVLTQRNALLRRIADTDGSPDELAYWDDQLTEAGAVLVAGRQRLLRELEVKARRIHRDLSRGTRKTSNCVTSRASCPRLNNTGQLSFDVLGLDLNRQLDASDHRRAVRASVWARRWARKSLAA